MTRPLHKWEPALCAAIALAVHALTLGNFFYGHDGWNDLATGEQILEGALTWQENLLRLLPTLTFAPRAAFGPEPWVWHLPNTLLHALNAALIVILTARLGGTRGARLLAGTLFAAGTLLTHPVEWIGGGYDLFATAFVLLAALFFLDRRPLLASLACALALLSKESGATCVGLVAALAIAVEGWPPSRADKLALARRLAPLALITLLLVGLRALQVYATPTDAQLGRTISPDPLRLLIAAPAAVGLAAIQSLAELLGLRAPTHAMLYGLASLATLGLWASLTKSRALLWLALAAAMALVPVSLIAMGLPEMVDNARYLYLSAALCAPALPLALGLHTRLTQALGLAIALVAIYGATDRVQHAAAQTAAVKPLAAAVLGAPRGTHVVVLTNLYDEASARFLMSRWLTHRRGIRARYVMRGTGLTYTRYFGASEDSSLSYFGPTRLRFSPRLIAPRDLLLLQRPATREVRRLPRLTARPTGAWETVTGPWTALKRPDPQDPPIQIDRGHVLHMDLRLGPAATAQHNPLATLPIQEGLITGVELTVRVHTRAPLRYGVSYHERYGALFFGPNDAFASFELQDTGGTPQTITFDLSWDPDLAPTDHLGLLPLNYPGTLTVDKVRIRR